MPPNEKFSAPGASTYDSDTVHVGDGTWDFSKNAFLLPNLVGYNMETLQYNGMGNRFSTLTQYHSMILAHGLLAVFVFLLLVPYAIYSARFNRSRTALHHHLRAHLCAIFLLTVVFALGWLAVGPRRSLSNPHHAIGLAIYLLYWFQLLAGVFARAVVKRVSLRVKLHRWIGRCLALLGMIQIPLGLALYGSKLYLFILYAIFMGSLAIAYFFLDYVRDKKRYRHRGRHGGGGGGSGRYGSASGYNGGTVVSSRTSGDSSGFLSGKMKWLAPLAALVGIWAYKRRSRSHSRGSSSSRSRSTSRSPSRYSHSRGPFSVHPGSESYYHTEEKMSHATSGRRPSHYTTAESPSKKSGGFLTKLVGVGAAMGGAKLIGNLMSGKESSKKSKKPVVDPKSSTYHHHHNHHSDGDDDYSYISSQNPQRPQRSHSMTDITDLDTASRYSRPTTTAYTATTFSRPPHAARPSHTSRPTSTSYYSYDDESATDYHYDGATSYHPSSEPTHASSVKPAVKAAGLAGLMGGLGAMFFGRKKGADEAKQTPPPPKKPYTSPDKRKTSRYRPTDSLIDEEEDESETDSDSEYRRRPPRPVSGPSRPPSGRASSRHSAHSGRMTAAAAAAAVAGAGAAAGTALAGRQKRTDTYRPESPSISSSDLDSSVLDSRPAPAAAPLTRPSSQHGHAAEPPPMAPLTDFSHRRKPSGDTYLDMPPVPPDHTDPFPPPITATTGAGTGGGPSRRSSAHRRTVAARRQQEHEASRPSLDDHTASTIPDDDRRHRRQQSTGPASTYAPPPPPSTHQGPPSTYAPTHQGPPSTYGSTYQGPSSAYGPAPGQPLSSGAPPPPPASAYQSPRLPEAYPRPTNPTTTTTTTTAQTPIRVPPIHDDVTIRRLTGDEIASVRRRPSASLDSSSDEDTTPIQPPKRRYRRNERPRHSGHGHAAAPGAAGAAYPPPPPHSTTTTNTTATTTATVPTGHHNQSLGAGGGGGGGGGAYGHPAESYLAPSTAAHSGTIRPVPQHPQHTQHAHPHPPGSVHPSVHPSAPPPTDPTVSSVEQSVETEAFEDYDAVPTDGLTWLQNAEENRRRRRMERQQALQGGVMSDTFSD